MADHRSHRIAAFLRDEKKGAVLRSVTTGEVVRFAPFRPSDQSPWQDANGRRYASLDVEPDWSGVDDR